MKTIQNSEPGGINKIYFTCFISLPSIGYTYKQTLCQTSEMLTFSILKLTLTTPFVSNLKTGTYKCQTIRNSANKTPELQWLGSLS